MTTGRDFMTEMTHMISEELNAHRGDDDAYMQAMEKRISSDTELLNFLTHPSLRSVIARWTREYQSSERFAGRPENEAVIDKIEDGDFSPKAPKMAAIMTRTNGREVLTKAFLDQYRYGKVLRDWIVCELREVMTGRHRAMSTEKRELGWLGRMCDLAETIGGSDKVKIGDYVTAEHVDAITKGEEPVIKPKPRRSQRPHAA